MILRGLALSVLWWIVTGLAGPWLDLRPMLGWLSLILAVSIRFI